MIRLTGKTQNCCDQLIKELKHLFDARLVSVCVYGSAAATLSGSDSGKPVSDINVIVILTHLVSADWDRASSIGKWWEQVGHSLPLFFSESEWLRSSDVFALEYADIRDQHYVLYGKDLYSQTTVDKEALRLVLELELHRTLIYLRQRLMIHRDNPRELEKLLLSRLGNLAALFRGVLRLKSDAPVPMRHSDVFEALPNVIEGFVAQPFLTLEQRRHREIKLSTHDDLSLYFAALEQIGRVTDYVDQVYGFISKQEGVLS